MLKRSSKSFVISTESPNNKNFRVRSAGIDFSAYTENPLLLWMHQRPKGMSKDEVLPLGNMEELELRDGKLYGRPCFDTTDTFAGSLYAKVENGTLRMASAGLLPLLWSKDEKGDLWLEKSKLVEVSLVDIGSNPDALAVKLYNENQEVVTLSDEYMSTIIPTQNQNENMKLIQLSADVLPLIGLAEGATPEAVQTAIQELVTLSSTQKTHLETLASEKTESDAKVVELSAKITDLETLANTEKVNALVDAAEIGKKITADQKPMFVKLANADFDNTKSLLESMPGNPSVMSQLDKQKESETAQYEKLSWEEMDKSGKLIKLKAEHPDLFAAKYKEQFGTEYGKK